MSWSSRVSWLLRLPLGAKLTGANGLVALLAWGAVYALGGSFRNDWRMLVLLAVALAAGLVVNIVLVRLALRPVGDLERTALAVSEGDLSARVPRSPVADVELERIGHTLNMLLDQLVGDRARMRALAAEVIHAGDRERAALARDLHDSIAQSLAAVTYQLSAAGRESTEPALAERLSALRQLSADVLEEVRVLAHTVHPRVLEDLGLVAGLRQLARKVATGTSVDVRVELARGTEEGVRALALDATSALYRVGQEAVRNAIRHAQANRVDIVVAADGAAVSLEVRDDGTGFDVGEAETRRPGMGLFTMRERVRLVNGSFEVTTAPGRGTSVQATVPLGRDTFPESGSGDKRNHRERKDRYAR